MCCAAEQNDVGHFWGGGITVPHVQFTVILFLGGGGVGVFSAAA